jgi:hypothetical protein
MYSVFIRKKEKAAAHLIEMKQMALIRQTNLIAANKQMSIQEAVHNNFMFMG